MIADRAEGGFAGQHRMALAIARAAVASWKAVGPFVAFGAAWALLSRLTGWPDDFLPSPFAVGGALGEMAYKGILPAYSRQTIWRIVIGGATGIGFGIPVGFAMSLNERVSALLYPPIRFFQSLSGIAWLPLFLMWFGFTEKAVIVAVWYTLFFPVVFNTIMGVRMVPKLHRDSVLTLGGRWRHIVSQVLLPGALPHIVGGIRLGMAFGWRALIAAEIVVGTGGLGFLIFKAQTFHLTPRIMAGMIVIGGLWYITDYFLLRPLEQATIERWGLVYR